MDVAAGESSPLDKELLEAVSQGDSALVAELVTRGAHINAHDSNGVSALIKASVNRNLDAVKTLLGKGADVDARDRYGRTALMYAAEHGHAEVVTCLVDRGADIDAGNHFNVTALMYAIDRKTDVGRTALIMAVSAQKPEEVEIFWMRAQTSMPAIITDGPR